MSNDSKTPIQKTLQPTKSDHSHDRWVGALRAATGLAGPLGPAVIECLSGIVKDTQESRFRNVFLFMERRLNEHQAEIFGLNLKTQASANLLVEGLEQAGQAILEARQKALANVLADGLSRDKIEHEQDFLVLRTLTDLSDYELIHLVWQANHRSAEFQIDADAFAATHKEILDPRSVDLDSDPQLVGMHRVQLQHQINLVQKGLLEYASKDSSNPSFRFSKFGRHILQKLDVENAFEITSQAD